MRAFVSGTATHALLIPEQPLWPSDLDTKTTWVVRFLRPSIQSPKHGTSGVARRFLKDAPRYVSVTGSSPSTQNKPRPDD